PHIHDGPWRFEVKAKYDKVLFSNYFGSGNTVFSGDFFGPLADPEAFSQNDLDKIADYYHSYERTEPKLIVNLRRDLGDRFRLFLGAEAKRVTVDPHTPDTIADFESFTVDPGWESFLVQTQPYGIGGGDVGEAQVGLVYDTRDQEASPTHGSFFEVSARGMYFNAKDAAEAEGMDKVYEGANVTDRH